MLKRIILLLLFPLFLVFGKGETVTTTKNSNYGNNSLESITETAIDTISILDTLNTSMMKTDFVVTDDLFQFVEMENYQGQEKSKTVDLEVYKQLLFQLEKSAINKTREKSKPYTNFVEKLNNPTKISKHFSESDIPIYISLYTYEQYHNDHKGYYTLHCNLFNVFPLKEQTFRGSKVRFNFSKTNSFISSSAPQIQYIMVDFGDGAGYRTINIQGNFSVDIDVNYSSIGLKNIKTKVKFTGYSNIFYSYSKIKVETLTIPDPTYTLNLESSLSYNNSKATGKAYVYRSNQNSTIKNPIIFVEGFDINESMNADELYDMLRQQNLAETLNNKGYDIIILNFNYAKDYIQKNAFLLVKLIQEINLIKDGKNELIVIGASMGGLVSRYALTYMENHNIDHETRLFVSFDSPQKGANIPLGVQYWLRFFASENSTAKEFRNKLKSVAAQQMLIYNFVSFPYPNSYRQTFMNELDNYGYPQKLRKVAISNGTGTGNGLDFGAGWRILKYHYDSWKVDIVGDAWAVDDNSLRKCFKGIIDKFGPSYREWVIKVKVGMKVDNIPGGYRKTQKQIADTDVKYGNIHTSHPKHCFIPSISSLAINTNNPFYNIKTDNNILAKTPFDAIYFPIFNENINQEHIYISAEIKNWMLEELIPNNITLDSEEVWGQGNIKAKNTIKLLPGFNANSSSKLKLLIDN